MRWSGFLAALLLFWACSHSPTYAESPSEAEILLALRSIVTELDRAYESQQAISSELATQSTRLGELSTQLETLSIELESIATTRLTHIETQVTSLETSYLAWMERTDRKIMLLAGALGASVLLALLALLLG